MSRAEVILLIAVKSLGLHWKTNIYSKVKCEIWNLKEKSTLQIEIYVFLT